MNSRKRQDPSLFAPGASRREFLGSLGSGLAGAALVQGTPAAQRVVEVTPGLIDVTLRVNDVVHRLRIEPRLTLLDVLRDHLGLMGTKLGCGRGECGACTVLVDGVPRYACMMLAPEAESSSITTVEGLLRGEEPGPVQRAFMEEDGFQCGYCTPGQVMAVEGLLRTVPDPTFEQIREGLSGNLCRCGAYAHIFKAARRAADLRRNGGR